jgi:DNA-binding transcriptional LysR family regulator
MDTAEIEVFLTLAEELHFGRAAERLLIPQPRVSRLLAALECRVGGVLFERTSRRVRLTPLGQRLRNQVTPGYAQFTAAIDDARAAARGITGVLRVGFTVTTGGEALTRLVDAFETRNRDCRVALFEHQAHADDWDLWGPLRRGESDVLVDWLAVDEPDLTAGPAIDHRARVLAVARRHRLAARESVSAEELALEQVARLPPSFPQAQYDAIIPPCTPLGRPIPRTEPVCSFHELPSLVARGQIVHPTMTGIPLLHRDDIALIPICDLPPMPLGLIWCTANENTRIRALAAAARALVPRALRAPGSPARTRRLPAGVTR